MNLAIRIASRYLFSKKSTNAINVIAGISIIGMGVGAFALLVILSVFNGFEDLVVSLYNVFHPDIEIRAQEGKIFEFDDAIFNDIKNMDDVLYLSPVLEENAYFKYGENEFIGTIKGVEDQFMAITQLDSFVYYGTSRLTNGNQSFAIIGAGVDMALDINVEQPVGPISVMVPKRGLKSAILPSDAFNQRFILPGGVFAVQQDFDSKYMIVPLQFARDLLNYENKVSSVEIRLAGNSKMQRVKKEVAQKLGPAYIVKDKYEQKEVLFRVMRAERWAVYAILSFVMLIISFNIVGSLSMLVMEKGKDITILHAMGATSNVIRNIFLSEGFLMAMIGGISGLILGTLVCFIQIIFGIVKIAGTGSFVIDAYPVKLLPGDFILILITIIAISLVASWIPSRKAGSQELYLRQEG